MDFKYLLSNTLDITDMCLEIFLSYSKYHTNIKEFKCTLIDIDKNQNLTLPGIFFSNKNGLLLKIDYIFQKLYQ